MTMLQTRKNSGLVIMMMAALLLQTVAYAGQTNDDSSPLDPERYSDWSVVGPTGGDVRVIAIDPKDKNRLYISTLDGQIHTSADGGKTWMLLANLNKPQMIVDQLFVDSRDSKSIYASGHRGNAPGGFFRTT